MRESIGKANLEFEPLANRHVTSCSELSSGEFRSFYKIQTEKWSHLMCDESIGLCMCIAKIKEKNTRLEQDVIRERIFRCFRAKSIAMWLSMYKRHDFGNFTMSQIINSFCRSILDIPPTVHIGAYEEAEFFVNALLFDNGCGQLNMDEYYEYGNSLELNLFGRQLNGKDICNVLLYLNDGDASYIFHDEDKNITTFAFGRAEKQKLMNIDITLFSEIYCCSPNFSIMAAHPVDRAIVASLAM
jgi:hypothetical protein